MKKIRYDGMEFGKAEIGENRDSVIRLRDGALEQGNFLWAVTLSHTIAILAAAIEDVEE